MRLIPLGNMRAPKARRRLRAELDLTVYDQAMSGLAPLQALDAETGTEPEACSQCDIVIVVVEKHDPVREVVAEPDGVWWPPTPDCRLRS